MREPDITMLPFFFFHLFNALCRTFPRLTHIPKMGFYSAAEPQMLRDS